MLSALALVSVLSAEPAWRLAGEAPGGVRWYTRERPGEAVHELKATALLDAPTAQVWAVLLDFERYVDTMPSTAEAKVLDRDGPAVSFLYTRYAVPVLAPRDTVVRLEDQTRDPAVARVLSWRATDAKDTLAPPKPGVVRVRKNEGQWRLEPRDEGRRTFVVYTLFSAPGGDVPAFLVNQVNGVGVPSTLESLTRAANARAR